MRLELQKKINDLRAQIEALEELDRFEKGLSSKGVLLSIDGNQAAALLGENLQIGEVEFYEVEKSSSFLHSLGMPNGIVTDNMIKSHACIMAFEALCKRLNRYDLEQVWSPGLEHKP